MIAVWDDDSYWLDGLLRWNVAVDTELLKLMFGNDVAYAACAAYPRKVTAESGITPLTVKLWGCVLLVIYDPDYV